MNHLSLRLLSDIVVSRRKSLKLSQTALSNMANINRSVLSRLEAGDYSPSVDQLLSLSSVLGFRFSDVIVDDEAEIVAVGGKKIAGAGTGVAFGTGVTAGDGLAAGSSSAAGLGTGMNSVGALAPVNTA